MIEATLLPQETLEDTKKQRASARLAARAKRAEMARKFLGGC